MALTDFVKPPTRVQCVTCRLLAVLESDESKQMQALTRLTALPVGTPGRVSARAASDALAAWLNAEVGIDVPVPTGPSIRKHLAGRHDQRK